MKKSIQVEDFDVFYHPTNETRGYAVEVFGPDGLLARSRILRKANIEQCKDWAALQIKNYMREFKFRCMECGEVLKVEYNHTC